MSQKIKAAISPVRTILEKHPSLRDDNPRLVANIWHEELKSLGIEITPQITKMLTLISTKLTSAESITRASRTLQKDVPDLRGRDWEKRQAHAVKVKKALRDIQAEIAKA